MMKSLVEAVEKSLEKMQAEGITGWGLNNPDPEAFDRVQVGASVGCTSDTCAHNSHDPSAPNFKLVPKGDLSFLGTDNDYGYWIVGGNRVFRLRYETSYWARLTEIDFSEVPAYLLANLAE